MIPAKRRIPGTDLFLTVPRMATAADISRRRCSFVSELPLLCAR
jgi:hypothetical protein